MGACITLEKHPCRNHLGFIENHYGAFWQKGRKIPETVFLYVCVLVMEQFGRVALRKRILCDAGIVQRVVVIVNFNLRNHSAKLTKMRSHF